MVQVDGSGDSQDNNISYCHRPDDMNYKGAVSICGMNAPGLVGELVAGLSSAALVFKYIIYLMLLSFPWIVRIYACEFCGMDEVINTMEEHCGKCTELRAMN